MYAVLQGLLPAMGDFFPNVEQRFYVRHLYNNFRKRYPGKMLKGNYMEDCKINILTSMGKRDKGNEIDQ